MTIVSLATGIFTQQLLGIHSFPQSFKLEPIPHSKAWAYSEGNSAEVGKYSMSSSNVYSDKDIAISTSLEMKAAVYSGILDPSVEPVSAACPTGNCT